MTKDDVIKMLWGVAAQPAQEPISFLAQPWVMRREWVGLTDDEVNAATAVIEEQVLIRVMEAKLKERNA